jgi:threonine/homoserine/homoserine lactone efflux protein
LEGAVLAKGFLAGIAIAAPVGPVAILCAHRVLSSGRAAGFLSGLGAATVHAAYGLVAGFGIASLSAVLLRHQPLLRGGAALFLLLLGARVLVSHPTDRQERTGGGGLAGAYASAMLLALSSPITILTIAAVLSAAGVAGTGPAALTLAAGVFLGSASWWLLLSIGVDALAAKGGISALRAANRVAGAALSGFGLYIVVRLLL